MKLGPFELPEKISDSETFSIYRGQNTSTGQPVVVKLMHSTAATVSNLARLREEFHITQIFSHPNIIQAYSLEIIDGQHALILEDFGGQALENKKGWAEAPLTDKIAVALQMAKAIQEVHDKKVIHKDINLSNFTINKDGLVKLIDFGISSRLASETESLSDPDVVEGTLAYIAPEQTGRMNRNIDYRSDYYSLGVSLYRYFSGQFPFSEKGKLELIHSHMVKHPEPPSQFNPEIPEPVDNIVLKLMSKEANQRYQTIEALIKDLDFCLTELKTKGTVGDYQIAENDVSPYFKVEEKLYGRDKEVTLLLESFAKVKESQEKNMLLIGGYPGIGKSSCVREIYKPLTQAQSYFISGKFDQYKKNVPFFGIRKAFEDLLHSLATESKEEIEIWKERVKVEVGEDLPMLKSIIPDLELLLPIKDLEENLLVENAQKRFTMALSKLLKAFCIPGRPLVMFIDDLHWADSASLLTIQGWMQDETVSNFFLIGSYRDNEVHETHPLQFMLDEFKKTSVPHQKMTIKPINESDVNNLIADSLHLPKEETSSLSRLVFEKTNGNPFFVDQFLTILADEKWLQFSAQEMRWTWDLNKIKGLDVTENVIELLLYKLKKLSPLAQSVLSHGALIGHSFSLKQIRYTRDEEMELLHEALQTCIQQGYLVTRGSSHELYQITEESENLNFYFKHDRIQQASYSLLTPEQQLQLHASYGRILWQEYSTDSSVESLFELTGHLNKCESILSEKEKNELAELNLKAGENARNTSAYGTYYNYTQAVIKDLPEDCWDQDYKKTLNIYNKHVDACFLNQKNDELKAIVKEVIENVREPLDKYFAVRMISQYYTSHNRYQDSVDICVDFLRENNMSVAQKINLGHVIFGILRAKFAVRNLTDEYILNMPEMSDPLPIALCELTREVSAAYYYINSGAVPYFATKVLTDYNLPKGHNKDTPYLWAGYALILSNGTKEFKQGIRFAEVAMKLLEKRGQIDIGTEHLVRFFVLHYRDPFAKLASDCQGAFDRGLNVGAFEFACYQASASLHFRLYAGDNLDSILETTQKFSKVFKDIQQDGASDITSPYLQLVHNLVEEDIENPEYIGGQYLDPEPWLQRMIDQKFGPAVVYYHLFSILSCLLFEKWEKAGDHLQQVGPYIETNIGMPCDPFIKWYSGLVQLELIKKNYPQKWKRKRQIKKSISLLKQWGKHGPNYKNKYLHLKAELEAFHGKHQQAKSLFEKALFEAKKTNLTSDLAIIHERFADFLYSIEDRQAVDHVYKAHQYFTQWGARSKVKQLEKKYSHIFQLALPESDRTESKTRTSNRTTNTSLDLQAIIEASQKISAEIDMDKLIASVMKVLAESAGAELGHLIFVTDEDYKSVAHFPTSNSQAGFSESIVNYVYRTKEVVLVGNGCENEQFGKDPYIQENEVQSVLCLPLMNSGVLKGIIYLENNQSKDVFNLGRVETLNILASQAAISIQNAQLIENLSEKIRMESELKTASLVQATLLPESQYESEEVKIVGFYEPASECGGDWYYHKDLGDKILLCIADATGHGVPAALVTAAARSAMAVLEHSTDQGVGVITEMMNKAIYSCAKGNVFMTFFVAILDKTTGQVEYCNASHHEPILIDNSSESVSWSSLQYLESSTGKLLGQDVNAVYPVRQQILQPGTRLIFYTDGVTELKNESDQMWGESRFMRCIAKSYNETNDTASFMELINQGIRKHQNGFMLEDDLTYFTVDFKAVKKMKKVA